MKILKASVFFKKTLRLHGCINIERTHPILPPLLLCWECFHKNSTEMMALVTVLEFLFFRSREEPRPALWAEQCNELKCCQAGHHPPSTVAVQPHFKGSCVQISWTWPKWSCMATKLRELLLTWSEVSSSQENVWCHSLNSVQVSQLRNTALAEGQTFEANYHLFFPGRILGYTHGSKLKTHLETEFHLVPK